MSRFRIEVLVKPRPGLLDPQGKAIHSALSNLGYAAVDEVRVGKAIYLDLIADSVDQATAMADEMCRKLLANPVTEDFTISAEELPGANATAGATP
ncbi:MAG: phosphoribosylformylglycinamidine synthase subunit PurS [Gemmatimonadota bacterium]|nr:phosphoribosylformylglycinamidine synthase subunit PurS [Gemmatimonadota bacterium]